MEHTCKLCGHTWQGRVKLPVVCPRCKRYNWHRKSIKDLQEEAKKEREGEK